MAFYRQWLLILFALILSDGHLSAASTKEQSAYAAAVAAFQSEMWSRGEAGFSQFVQKYPKSTNAPMAVLLEAQAEFKQNQFPTAIALLDGHKSAAGTLADQYVYWIGEAQFQNGDPTNAAETFMSLAQNFPDSSLRLSSVVEAAAAYAECTNWLRHDALLEDTNGVFRRAAQLDPGNKLVANGRLSLENSKYRQRDFQGAVAVYELLTNQWQTLNQGQQCQGAYLYYLAKMELGDFAAALAASTNLVQIAGTSTNRYWLGTAWASQGMALEKMDRVPEAILAWRNNLTNAPAEQQREAIQKIAALAAGLKQFSDAEQALEQFVAQFPDSPQADMALLTLGELRLKDYAAQPAATNQLSAAQECYDKFFRNFTNSPLAGKAYLDRGWCESLAGDTTNSLADFKAAAQRLPPSEDLAVARFKTGDALFALSDYADALENYHSVLEDFTNFPAVAGALGDHALYQSLRANLELTNMDGANSALTQILDRFPASELAPNSALLYGEGLAEALQPVNSREQFKKFLALFPDTRLRPQVEFAIARTYDLQQDWSNAIAGYQGWLDRFPTNQFQQQAIYGLARANFKAGNETNAFGLFTNFVAQFPTNELAPQAQWWIADYFFRLGGANYADAEKNYVLVSQNQNFPRNDLAYPARLMAGRAAVARQDYSDANRDYFSKLEADTNCPADLRQQAIFAHGSALMHAESTATNNPLANFQLAAMVFAQLEPTNEIGALAMIEIGNCNLQLTNYDKSTNAYAQVASSTNTSVSARSQAQIGLGIALEKMAALATGADQTNLKQMALDDYLKVFDTWTGNNLMPGERADLFWVKKAGLQALPLLQTLGAGDPDKFINQMEELFPQSKDSLEKKRAALSPVKN
jgi:TolA-binding protein